MLRLQVCTTMYCLIKAIKLCLFLFKFVCVCMCVCVGRHLEVVSLLLPYESQGLNSDHWVWQELPLPTELFHWPHCYILITIYLLFTSRVCHSKLLFLKLSYICVCVPVCKPHECYTRTWCPLYLESWVVMSRPIRLLGTKLTFFCKTHITKHWAVFLETYFYLKSCFQPLRQGFMWPRLVLSSLCSLG